MRNVNRFLLALVIIFIFSNLSFAQNFAADIVSRSGKALTNGKIFISGDKLRMEMQGAVSITRLDKKVMWMLMPQEKMYMQMPIPAENLIAGKDKVSGEIERTLLGEEVIDGKLAEKYRIVYDSDGKKTAVISWILKDLGLPVKTVSEDGKWQMEYKNIKVGQQDPTLFELPSDYKAITMPARPSLKDIGGMFK